MMSVPKIVVAVKGKFQKTAYDPSGISPSVMGGHGDVVWVAVVARKELKSLVVYGHLYDLRDQHFKYPLPPTAAMRRRMDREREEEAMADLGEWFG